MWDERVNILIVDDHRENLLALNAILQDLAQNVVSVESGRDALRRVLNMDFALILMDVEMPFMDGFETARLIRQREASRHTPIIFLTAVNRTNQHVFEGYSIGAVDYLLKPFDPEILKSKVVAFVELFKKNKEITQQKLMLEQVNRELHIERDFVSAVLDTADSIVLVINAERSIIRSNRAFERILGYSADEVLGRELSGFFALAQSNATGTMPTENYWTTKDGKTRLIAWSQTPLRNRRGELDCLIVTGNDITERKRGEEERAQFIREQAARAEAEAAQRRSAFLSEAGAMLVSSIDYETTIANVSRLAIPQFADWTFVFQVEEGEVVAAQMAHREPGKEELLRRIVPTRIDFESWQSPLGRVLSSGKAELLSIITPADIESMMSQEAHQTLIDHAGCASALIASIPAVGGAWGVIGFVSATSGFYRDPELQVAEDLAQRIGLALENARLYRSAQQASCAKDEFLATLSHEIRTPLNAILGWVQIAQKKPTGETLDKAIEAVERNARMQANLIEDMLDVSRIITGKLRLELQQTDVMSPLESALESVRPAADAKGIRIETSFMSCEAILADRDRLQQIVWNLLANAIKFTPSGGEVRLELNQIGSEVRVSVADTGKGISKQFLPFVFDRFRQAEASTRRSFGGLGLGLSIVRHLVELHGGTILAESEGEGKGARFVVSFPVKQHARSFASQV